MEITDSSPDTAAAEPARDTEGRFCHIYVGDNSWEVGKDGLCRAGR